MTLKQKYTVDYIEENNLLLLKVLSGSYSQNLQTDKSDIDYTGVFIMEPEDYYSLHNKKEEFDTVIQNHPQDVTYFEVGKFFELLSKNNPNALEIMASAFIKENCIYVSEVFKSFDMKMILSKKCQYTFGKYASDQVKKATGLNKKINNPISPKKKTIIDFCKFYSSYDSVMLSTFLKNNGIDQKFIGLSPIKNAKSTYRVYVDMHSLACFSDNEPKTAEFKKNYKFAKFKGVINPDKKELSNQIRVSSIPKKNTSTWSKYYILELGYIYYNLEGYETYCKDYAQYFEWVKKRNDERYKNNIGQQFDVKNMSHCCRLLTMAKEIALEEKIKIRRDDDADFFRNIKIGKVDYKEVINYSNEYVTNLEKWYKQSKLRNEPDFNYLNYYLVKIRKEYYGR